MPTRIDQLTQDEFVAAIIAGAQLLLPDGRTWAPLDEPLRRVLRGVWPDRIREPDRNASPDEASDILAAVGTDDPLPTWSSTAPIVSTPKWRLLAISVRHFGGVNGPLGDDPVEIEVPQQGLLVYGRNGSGKSSLARAIIWGLTGHVIDTDGLDKPAGDVTSNYKSDDGAYAASLPTIVPFPTREQLNDPTKIRLPRVILKFRRQPSCTVLVERALTRTGRRFDQSCHFATFSDDGQLSWSPTDDVSTALGIPRQALENAALQVARLEKLNPSAERNPLAAGLERLSGLTRLGEISDRLADRLSRYLCVGYANGLQDDADRERTKVKDALERMKSALEGAGLEPLPDGDTSAPDTCRQYLDKITTLLAPKRDAADQSLSDVLGVAKDVSPPANVQADLVRARDEISNLASADPLEILLSAWATPERSSELRRKAEEISARLERYRSLQQDRARKVRSALYSRIEKWAEDEGQTPVDWSDCPVCETDLADRNDPMLDEPIRQAAEQARRDAELLREDAARLDAAWSGELAGLWDGCPGVDDLGLLGRAPELLAIEPWRGRSDLLGLIAKKVLSAPPREAAHADKPVAGDYLHTRAALATAETLAERLDFLAVAADDIRRKRSCVIREMNDVLQRVDEALCSHEPIRRALSDLETARMALAAWTPIHARVALAKSIGPRLADFRRVREAIDAIVAHALGTLKNRAIGEYYAKLYRAPWTGQPQVHDVEAAQDARLNVLATVGDVTGDGARLLNHSHLRAVLLAFAGALKENADRRSGGLDVMVLDDPQTLVDEINRDGLGSWLKALRGAKSCPVVFTHSDAFASVVEAKLETPRMRVRPSCGMRDRGHLLVIGGVNEIKELADQLLQSSDEANCTKLCAAIWVELEDRLRTYCDVLSLEMKTDRPMLHDCRMALKNARSQPAYKAILST